MELVFEIIVEFIFEIYLELMFLVVPDHKKQKKWVRGLAAVLAILMLVAVLALFLWGAYMLGENTLYGMILIVLAVALSLAQIIAGIILYQKNH